MSRRVFLATRDLVFRSKLGGLAAGLGAEVVRDDAGCDLGVIEIETPGWEARIRALVGRGVPVLAYGSHVGADLLRAARRAGAEAVPNSEVEKRLRQLLTSG